LKELTRTVLGREVIELASFGTTNFALLDAQDPRVQAYMEQDALNARDLHAHLTRFLLGPLRPIYTEEVALAVTMAHAWVEGATVDLPALDQRLVAATTEATVREQAVFDLLGGPFLVGSPAQLGKRLLERGIESPVRTPTGQMSWSADALEPLRGHPPIDAVLAWRRVATEIQQLDSLRRVQSGGMLYPTWWTLGKDGDPAMSATDPPLTTLSQRARYYLRAAEGYQWVHVCWPPVVEVWWTLGWLHPAFVSDGLQQWEASASAIGVTAAEFARLACAWALGDEDAGYMARKVAVSPRCVEAARLALHATWGPLLDRVRRVLAETEYVRVVGVHEWSLHVPEGAPQQRQKALLRLVCHYNRWAASKRLVAYLSASALGRHYIPIAGTVSFETRHPVGEIGEVLDSYAFRHRPLVLPLGVSAGASWGAAVEASRVQETAL
jgi:hypothetical protein